MEDIINLFVDFFQFIKRTKWYNSKKNFVSLADNAILLENNVSREIEEQLFVPYAHLKCQKGDVKFIFLEWHISCFYRVFLLDKNKHFLDRLNEIELRQLSQSNNNYLVQIKF